MRSRQVSNADESPQRWHRAAISGTSQGYYFEWREYEGRHPVKQAATEEHNTWAAICDLYESLSSWEYEVDRWIERSDEYLKGKATDDYEFKRIGETWHLSRIEEGTHSGNAASRKRHHTRSADPDGIDVD